MDRVRRFIRLDGAFNVRDLGGYPAAGGRETAWRRLLRADGIHRLSPGEAARLVALGVTTVVDLRSPKELRLEPNPFAGEPAVRFVPLPLMEGLSPVDTGRSAAASGFDMARRYCEAIDHCGAQIVAVLEAMAAAGEGVVLFHCSAGKDRTGIIAALLLSLLEVDEATVVADYALTALVNAPLAGHLRRRSLALGTHPELVDTLLACRPETMRRMLAHIAGQYGSPAGYLRRQGLGGEATERLKRRMLVQAGQGG